MIKLSSAKNSPLAQFVKSLPQPLLPIASYSKNKAGFYTYVNEYTLTIANINTFKDFLDKSDKDMPWHAQAESVRKTDVEVMSKTTSKCTIDTVLIAQNTWASYLSIKVPTFDDQNVVNGIHGTSLHINMLNPSLLNSFLSNVDKSVQENIYKSLRTHALDIILPGDILTIREKECLLHLARGRSSREIADILGLSSRTVECHIENAKVKLGCKKKSQLIDRIFEHFPHFWLF